MRPYIVTTWVAIGLMALAAGAGLLWPGFYRDSSLVALQLRAWDSVTLFIVLPLLAVVLPKARMGNLRARVMWLGLMSYVVYTYAIYSFEVQHNPAFILYVALFSLSVLSVAGGSVNARPRGYSLVLADRFPRKSTGWFLIITGVTLAVFWLSDLGVALVTGKLPRSVIQFDSPTSGTYVLDLAFLIPAYISAGVLLLMRHPVGYLMTGILLVNAAAEGLAVMAMQATLAGSNQPTYPVLAILFAAFTALALAFLGFYLKALHTPAWHRFDLPIAREEDP
jgi:hypothetical protein